MGDIALVRNDGNSFTVTSWVYKDPSASRPKEDFQIYGRALIVRKDSLQFSVDTNRLSTGSSWDGKYGGSWNDLAKGWNSITLRYRKSGSKVDLFVNGKR